jgi:hypothetical protein
MIGELNQHQITVVVVIVIAIQVLNVKSFGNARRSQAWANGPLSAR